MDKPYLVGITGGSASGKTSFIQSLKEAFGSKDLCLVSQDNYYRPREVQQRDDQGQINFDLPTSINVENFLTDLENLKSGHSIEIKEYLFQNEEKTPQLICMEAAPIIVVEGLFIFHYEQIFKQLDLKIFIDANDDIKLDRRIRRDVDERGVSKEIVLYQWQQHVVPSYQKYLLPYKEAADIVINNNEHFLTSLEVIKNHFQKILHK
ncbi:MAG: uridine-cytidine kinase [Bacteroidetes bacterium]|nr:MAG: uridine-cytidine kinase [Bacteroidota bacterium]